MPRIYLDLARFDFIVSAVCICESSTYAASILQPKSQQVVLKTRLHALVILRPHTRVLQQLLAASLMASIAIAEHGECRIKTAGLALKTTLISIRGHIAST